ncbi:ornithine carbamoyltransferase [Bacillota bacterium LX-D]|nr:ornithine carbamoyltransferase [Bacillota bacterium LX-D]
MVSVLNLNSSLKGRDLISLHDYNTDEINFILEFAHWLKKKKKQGEPHELLKGKTLGMIFQKNSTRTRVSFETGMYHLGGSALFLSGSELQMGRGEPIRDTARTLSRYLDGIMIRTFSHEDVLELAKYADIPIINGLTDLLHPCQVLADLMTAQEHKGELKGLKLAFIGDGNNVAHSLMFGGAKVGMHVTIASPPGYEPNQEIVALATEDAKKTGGSITVTSDLKAAAQDADVLYTDVWASMGQEEEFEERKKILGTYQINGDLLKLAKKDVLVMHCLPAHRGEEITEEVFEGPNSVIFDEAENRLHAQKAVLALLL